MKKATCWYYRVVCGYEHGWGHVQSNGCSCLSMYTCIGVNAQRHKQVYMCIGYMNTQTHVYMGVYCLGDPGLLSGQAE